MLRYPDGVYSVYTYKDGLITEVVFGGFYIGDGDGEISDIPIVEN